MSAKAPRTRAQKRLAQARGSEGTAAEDLHFRRAGRVRPRARHPRPRHARSAARTEHPRGCSSSQRERDHASEEARRQASAEVARRHGRSVRQPSVGGQRSSPGKRLGAGGDADPFQLSSRWRLAERPGLDAQDGAGGRAVTAPEADRARNADPRSGRTTRMDRGHRLDSDEATDARTPSASRPELAATASAPVGAELLDPEAAPLGLLRRLHRALSRRWAAVQRSAAHVHAFGFRTAYVREILRY